jgi:hypothetical protein
MWNVLTVLWFMQLIRWQQVMVMHNVMPNRHQSDIQMGTLYGAACPACLYYVVLDHYLLHTS